MVIENHRLRRYIFSLIREKWRFRLKPSIEFQSDEGETKVQAETIL